MYGLVLGVEKMPFKDALSFMEDLALDLGGTTGTLTTQEERGVFKEHGAAVGIAPVICYESIFGEYFEN